MRRRGLFAQFMVVIQYGRFKVQIYTNTLMPLGYFTISFVSFFLFSLLFHSPALLAHTLEDTHRKIRCKNIISVRKLASIEMTFEALSKQSNNNIEVSKYHFGNKSVDIPNEL